MSSVTERQDCRACHGQLESIFHFGEHEIVNFGNKDPAKSPLELMLCKSCSLAQLHHTVNPDLLFRKYYYKSGVNQMMRNHLQSIVEDAMKRVTFNDPIGADGWETDSNVIVDIGANDGTLLSFFGEKAHFDRIAFEPSMNLMNEALASCEALVSDYFSAKAYEGIMGTKKAKLIFIIAAFYDLDDPGKFLDDVKQVLAPDGLFVIEQNYLPAMLEANRVDNISAEHLCYYSLSSLELLLASHAFEIEDVKLDEINGGVFRVYCRVLPTGTQARDAVVKYFMNEDHLQLDKIETYHKFIHRVQRNMNKLHDFIQHEARNLKVDAYAASTRGLMIMQLARLDETNIRQAVDRNPAKVGTKYNGIPVVSEEEMRKSQPHFLLLLAQHFLGETITREFEFLKNGGKFILPFPEPRILSLESL